MLAGTKAAETKLTAQPRTYNGEERLAQVLDYLGVDWTYEPHEYRLPGFGFKPDFYIAESNRRPAVNIELTFADKDLGKNRARSEAYLRRKQWKIRQVREIYGVHTILVTSREWKKIVRHPRFLFKLIDRELDRTKEVAMA